MNYQELQEEVGEWAYENFGEQPAHWCLKGALEEFGELCTSDLKTDQGLADTPKYQERGTVGPAAERDAVGDIVIYLMDYCYRSGISLPADGEIPGVVLLAAKQKSSAKDFAITKIAHGIAGAYTADLQGKEGWIVEDSLALAIQGLKIFCRAKGYDFDQCVEDAAEEVLGRDWNEERAKA